MSLFDSLLSGNSTINEVLSTTPFDFYQINSESAKKPAPEWISYIFIIEIVIIVLSLFWAVFTSRIFYRQPLFHVNIIALSISIIFLWWIMQLSRLTVCIGALFIDPEIKQNLSIFLVKPPFSLAEKIRVWAGYSAVASMCAVMYERSVATKRLDFYERVKSPFFVGLLIVGAYLLGLTGTYLIFYSPLFVTVSIILGTSFVVYVGIEYVRLKFKNRQQLRKSMLGAYTLSQSYQLRENMRVLIILKRFIATFMGTLSILFVLFTVGLFSQNSSATSDNQLYIVRSFGNLMCDLSGPLMIYSAITGTFAWRETLKQQLCWACFVGRRRNAVVSLQKPGFIKNLDGQTLKFDINKEQEIYFQQLKQAWA